MQRLCGDRAQSARNLSKMQYAASMRRQSAKCKKSVKNAICDYYEATERQDAAIGERAPSARNLLGMQYAAIMRRLRAKCKKSIKNATCGDYAATERRV